jgi:hypothetical protein
VLWRVLAETELEDPVWLDTKWTAFELALLIDVLELAILSATGLKFPKTTE